MGPMDERQYVIIAEGEVVAFGATPEEAVASADRAIRRQMPELIPEYGYMYKRVGYVEVQRVLQVAYTPEPKPTQDPSQG